LLDDPKPFKSFKGSFDFLLAIFEASFLSGEGGSSFVAFPANLSELGALEFNFPRLLGEARFEFSERRFLGYDSRLAGGQFVLPGLDREALVGGALLFDVQVCFAAIELALPPLDALPGLVQLLLSRAAGGGLKFEGVELGLLLGSAKLQIDLKGGNGLLTLLQLFEPLSKIVGFFELGRGRLLPLRELLLPRSQPTFEFVEFRFALVDPKAGIPNAGVKLRFLGVQPRFPAVDLRKTLLEAIREVGRMLRQHGWRR
jgi:hypothetical protein